MASDSKSRKVLIVGANRGIGLGFAQKFSSSGWEVFATMRTQAPEDTSGSELRATGATIFNLDYLDDDTITDAATSFGSGPLDLLINCAGISGAPLDWRDTDSALLTQYFQTMVVGPLLVSKAFLPNLELSASGKLVNISSRLASISQNSRGTKIAYKIAKAGLNQQSRTIALDLKSIGSNVAVLALDPGHVATRLSGWKGKIEMQESVSGMYDVIERATLAESGTFLRWNGEALPW